MSRVKDVEWSVNHVAAHELQSYLNKKAADGFELVNALDSDGAALVIMSKDTSVKSDWKTTVGVTSNIISSGMEGLLEELLEKTRQEITKQEASTDTNPVHLINLKHLLEKARRDYKET